MNSTTLSRRSFLEASGAAAAAATLAACGGNNNAAPSASDAASDGSSSDDAQASAELTTIPYCISGHDPNKVGLYVAIEKGYFAEEGIEIEIVMPQDDYGDVTIGTGVTPFGFEWQEYIAMARAKESGGLPLIAVAAVMPHQNAGIVSKKELGIEVPADLEGHSYGTWGSDIEVQILEMMMAKDGGDVNKVEIVPLSGGDITQGIMADMYDSAFCWGAVDVVNLAHNGVETNFYCISDSDPAIDYYSPVIGANEDWVAEHPDLTRAFLRALKRGYELANEDAETAAECLLKYSPELGEELALKMCEYNLGQFIGDGLPWGTFDPERWDRFSDWCNERGLVERDLEHGEGFTNDYLPEA